MSKCPYCGEAVKPTDSVCSNCFYDLRAQPSSASAPPMRTIQQVAPIEETPPAKSASTQKERTEPRQADPSQEESVDHASINIDAPDRSPQLKEKADGAVPFRPRLRPPMALVKILDDDGMDAECIRIRQKETVFGRSDGDIVIPHERMMSARHTILERRHEDGQYCWYLKDLGSTNGTFVKVKSGRLRHNSEIMLGAFRYRFDAAPQGGLEQAQADEAPVRTLGWKTVSPDDLTRHLPALIRITPEGETDRFALPDKKQYVGADVGSSQVVIGDDAMISGRHVRIYCDQHNRWNMEDAGSLNGVWLSIDQLRIEMSTQFQLGEQRFSIKIN